MPKHANSALEISEIDFRNECKTNGIFTSRTFIIASLKMCTWYRLVSYRFEWNANNCENIILFRSSLKDTLKSLDNFTVAC